MSANLDLVRSIFAAWERGDFSETEWAHSEIEYVVADGLQPGIWMGVGGMVERWREGEAVWEDFRVSADDYRDPEIESAMSIATTHSPTSASLRRRDERLCVVRSDVRGCLPDHFQRRRGSAGRSASWAATSAARSIVAAPSPIQRASQRSAQAS